MRKIKRDPAGPGVFRPGEDLAVVGTIGKAGLQAALEQKAGELNTRFSSSFMEQIRKRAKEQMKITPERLAAYGATEWEYVAEGGIFAALWTISGAYEQGISFDLQKIPISQELIEVCELFDVNPYRLRSGDCFLAAAENGGDFVRALQAEHIPAVWIGKVEPGIARRILNGENVGYLERPREDEIGKILGTFQEREEK